MRAAMNNQDAGCKLKELVARLHESVARLEDMRSALWLSIYSPKSFNRWYEDVYIKGLTTIDKYGSKLNQKKP
jgi:hypothetical protein